VPVRSVHASEQGLTTVFNLEVFARHEFFVGEARVRVHNGYSEAAERTVGGVATKGGFTTATVPVRTLRGRQGPAEFSSSKIRRLRRAMRADGFRPSGAIDIVEVDGVRIILDGHHRARAAGAVGIADVPVRIWQVSEESGATLWSQAVEAAERLGLRW
jgi:hypothetical protein